MTNEKIVFLILIASIAILIISFILAYTSLRKQVRTLASELQKSKQNGVTDKRRKNKSDESKQPRIKENDENIHVEPAPKAKQAKPKREPQPKRKHTKRLEDLLANEVKATGNDFEKFITQRLGKNRYFKLKGWRGSTETLEGEPLSSQQPDFVYEHVITGAFRRFAVDCVWTDKDEDCHIGNFDTLKAYETENTTPVFIIVGVGGSANKPESLSIVPVREMANATIGQAMLDKFSKSVVTPFHYDVNTGTLSEAPRKTEANSTPADTI